jgi:hypothetical protein
MKQPRYGNTFLIAVGLGVALIGTPPTPKALGADYSARTHYYAIEYLKPTGGTADVCVLNMTLNRQFDAQTAERLLRGELDRAVTLFPPKTDVMAYAWRQTDPSPGSEQVLSLADDSRFLIYLAKTKQTLTEKQYDLSLQKPGQPGHGINVEISLAFEKGADGRVRVLGKTNLPQGMSLGLDLRNAESKYFAQDKIEVIDGRIVSSWFSDHGKPLAAGTYGIEVSSPLPEFQSEAVRKIIGRNGENLSGAVRTSMGSKMVEYKTSKVLE